MPRNLYDDLDLLYREIWGTSLHHGLWMEGNESPSLAREKLVKLALSLLQPKGTIADIGCGYGVLAHRLIREFNCKVIANTSSLVQQQFIEPHPSLTILGRDWLQVDLPKDSLDGAIAIESFSHFPSFGACLDKTIAAMKPGARLLIADWFSETATTAQGGRIVQSLNLSSEAAPTWSHLFRAALTVLLRKPKLFPRFFTQLLGNPSLLWTFPLLRLAYKTGDLEYHLILIEK